MALAAWGRAAPLPRVFPLSRPDAPAEDGIFRPAPAVHRRVAGAGPGATLAGLRETVTGAGGGDGEASARRRRFRSPEERLKRSGAAAWGADAVRVGALLGKRRRALLVRRL